jgi:hypothetical protein
MAQSSQNVTLPVIPELFNPNFLDILVPVRTEDDVTMTDTSDVQSPTNPLVNAFLENNRTFTQNTAQALKSTGSATLDAFNNLGRWSFKEVNDALEGAWAEDPALALKLIWNFRSIHDGQGENELFYR